MIINCCKFDFWVLTIHCSRVYILYFYLLVFLFVYMIPFYDCKAMLVFLKLTHSVIPVVSRRLIRRDCIRL